MRNNILDHRKIFIIQVRVVTKAKRKLSLSVSFTISSRSYRNVFLYAIRSDIDFVTQKLRANVSVFCPCMTSYLLKLETNERLTDLIQRFFDKIVLIWSISTKIPQIIFHSLRQDWFWIMFLEEVQYRKLIISHFSARGGSLLRVESPSYYWYLESIITWWDGQSDQFFALKYDRNRNRLLFL